MNPIERNAILLLNILVESGKNDEYLPNHWLKEQSKLEPVDLNDAIAYLKSIGAIEVIRYLGTAPYNFGDVSLQSRGRYLYHEIKSRQEAAKKTDSAGSGIAPPGRPLNPVGSPYGFTEDDWLEVSLQKEDANVLYVVMGMQFESDYYDSKLLTDNWELLFNLAVKQFNKLGKRSNDVILKLEPLAAGLGEHLFNEIARNIIGADVAVFETSDLNANVMLEMGVALTWGVRVLPIKRKDSKALPSDISGLTWTEYDGSGEVIHDEKFEMKLLKMIERIISSKETAE